MYKEIDPEYWVYENEEDFIEGVLVQIQRDVGENDSMLYSLETPEEGLFIVRIRPIFINSDDSGPINSNLSF